MIPQDNFTVVARVPRESVAGLRELLATMNFPGRAGTANPHNTLIPFGKFDTIHFARLVILADNTLSDRAQYPQLPLNEPIYLCFMVDCDGDAGALLSRMAKECADLPRIFANCENFNANGDFEQWLRAHRVRPSASYVNWLGRCVIQVREEAHLHDLLRDALSRSAERNPQSLLAELRRDVGTAAPLTPPPPTPVAWRIRNLLHLLLPCAVAAAAFILFPFITIVTAAVTVPAFLIALRWHELHDPVIVNGYDAAWVKRLLKPIGWSQKEHGASRSLSGSSAIIRYRPMSGTRRILASPHAIWHATGASAAALRRRR
jgi:hypothetical protein